MCFRFIQLGKAKTLVLLFLVLNPGAYAIEHAAFDNILKQYVISGRVNYARMQLESGPDLNKYLHRLSKIPPSELKSLSKLEQLAFYINAYNAYTIYAILSHWPIESIRNIPNVWKEKKYKLAGKLFSLDQIEHEYVRSFGDPRVHFALNCASVGCPDLRSEAYLAVKIDNQLEEQARLFFSQSDKFYFCADCGDIKLSKIFQWFAVDFKDKTLSLSEKYGKFEGVINFIYKYVGVAQKERIRSEKMPLNFLEYDWSLNSSPTE